MALPGLPWIRRSSSFVLLVVLVVPSLLVSTLVHRIPGELNNNQLGIIHHLRLDQFKASPEDKFIRDLEHKRLPRCAIGIYGLPRAFKSLVLPTLILNVLRPNAKYNCDYFVHVYNKTHEAPGRHGQGGAIQVEEVFLLEKAVADTHNHTSNVVKIAVEQEADFWTSRETFLNKIKTAKDGEGRLLYHPWAEKTYRFPDTMNNIVKMWHSTQSTWNLIQEHASKMNIKYERAAMLRVDVVYMTVFDIWKRGSGDIYDFNNSHAVIPHFASWPVNDRLIYGPSEAVRQWSATRFEFIEEHVKWVLENKPGHGMHSETVVLRLLETIRNTTDVEKHDTMCFLRARADDTVWVGDCDRAPEYASLNITVPQDRRKWVSDILGRECEPGLVSIPPIGLSLRCPKNEHTVRDRTFRRTAPSK